MPSEFPAELKDFLSRYVGSLAQLELLLTLRRDPTQSMSVAILARQLYIDTDMCTRIVGDLERLGFLTAGEAGGEYRYQPASSELDARLGELEAVYRHRPVAVITEIYSRPVDKVQTLADAFRLRKEP